MHSTDEELQKWKVEDLGNYLLQRDVPIGNNAHKANLIKRDFRQVRFANSAQPRRT